MERQDVIITEEADAAIEAVQKNFNLVESFEEESQKFINGKMSNNVVLSVAAKDFFRGALTEKELVSSLQKGLEISQDLATQVSVEIIEKVVPLLKRYSMIREESKDREEGLGVLPKIKPLVRVEEILEKPKPDVGFKADVPPASRRKRTSEKKSVEQTQKPRSSGPDKYREPIE